MTREELLIKRLEELHTAHAETDDLVERAKLTRQIIAVSDALTRI